MMSKFAGLRNINSRANYDLMMIKDALELTIKKANDVINYYNTKATKKARKENLTLPAVMKLVATHVMSSQSSLSPSAITENFTLSNLTTTSHS